MRVTSDQHDISLSCKCFQFTARPALKPLKPSVGLIYFRNLADLSFSPQAAHSVPSSEIDPKIANVNIHQFFLHQKSREELPRAIAHLTVCDLSAVSQRGLMECLQAETHPEVWLLFAWRRMP